MIVFLESLKFDLDVSRNAVMGLFTPKRVNCVLKEDTIGSFLFLKNGLQKCRSPPVINLDFKKI